MEKIESTLTFQKKNIRIHDDETTIICGWLEEAYKIEFSCVDFMRDEDFFMPMRGGYDILGKTIEIKKYEKPEFLKLIGTDRVKLYFNKEIVNGRKLNDISYMIQIARMIDYPSTITYLEKLGLVKTRESESFIATDPRVFSLNYQEGKPNETDGSWYEVDILGTPYGKEITSYVLDLYKRIKKT